jgi:hypothetical protein
VDINRAWEILEKNIQISAKESLGHHDYTTINQGLMMKFHN